MSDTLQTTDTSQRIIDLLATNELVHLTRDTTPEIARRITDAFKGKGLLNVHIPTDKKRTGWKPMSTVKFLSAPVDKDGLDINFTNKGLYLFYKNEPRIALLQETAVVEGIYLTQNDRSKFGYNKVIFVSPEFI
jgi:hypothetical protein